MSVGRAPQRSSARGRLLAGTVAAVLVAGGLFTLAVVTRDGSSSTLPPSSRAGELTGPAPWPANSEMLRPRLEALGLPALAREGTVLHIHAHLDVFVDGERVIVPADIGIDPGGRFISPLHTHDSSGVIHVESPTVRTFALAQFFGVWGVRFTRHCLGGYCSSPEKPLRTYVDGRLVPDGRRVALAAHEEIVVAFGKLPQRVRARYAFPAGL